MPLNLKNPKAEALAQEVAQLANTTLTGAVILALESKRAELTQAKTAEQRLRAMRQLLEAEVWPLPIVDADTPEDEILGYTD